MERFILRQNVARFRSLLELKVGEQERCKLRVMLASARRELAVREAALSGIHLDGARLARAPLAAGRNPAARHLFQRLLEDPSHAYLVLDAGPGLQIVDVNDAFARSALVESSRVAGQPFFDVFPDNPADRQADGVSNVYAALQSAWQSGALIADPGRGYHG
jgi:PAS domain-containing protein